jgi:hypothetical protein
MGGDVREIARRTVVAFGAWRRVFDMFWAMDGGEMDGLYVRLIGDAASRRRSSLRFVRTSEMKADRFFE